MKTLHLTLSKKWFDMILSGEKKEEYREIKDYWATRLLYAAEQEAIEFHPWWEMLGDMKNPYRRHNGPKGLLEFFEVRFREYDAIHFMNGYGPARPSFDIEIENITIKKGRKDWGAEQGKFYFTFGLGNVLDGA